MRRRSLLLVLVAGWGCSFGALEGFSGGTPETPEAGTESGAPSDASSSIEDVRADIVVTPPDPQTACEKLDATLCRDFDEGDLQTGFDGLEALGTQTIAIVDGGLFTRLDTLQSGEGKVRLYKNIPQDAKRTRVSFDVKANPDAILGDGGTYFSIAEFLCGPDNALTGAWLHWVRNDGGTTLALKTSSATYRMLPPPTSWTRITLDVRWEATYADATVFYGSQVAIAQRMNNITCATKPPFRMVIGISSNVLVEASYDNVVYDLNPL